MSSDSKPELPPRIIALAIADLATERVRAAWRYLEAWQQLAAAGVGALELRLALETPETLTEPLAKLREWNERGLLVMHGVPGTGKSHAAILWLLATLDQNWRYPTMRGRSLCWLPATTWPHADRKKQEAWLQRGEDADCMVLDDEGAGTSEVAWSVAPMVGMIMNRISAGKRTVMLTNANGANTLDWLGPRLVSRIRTGGRIVEIKSRKDLRVADDVDLDESDHSPTWRINAEIVETIGCARIDGVLHVGGNLHRAVETDVAAARVRIGEDAKRTAWASCLRARVLLGLDPKAIQARAREIDDRERSVCGELSTTYGVEIEPGELTVSKALAAAHEMMRKKAEAESNRLRAANAAALEQRDGRGKAALAVVPERSTITVPAHVADSAVDVARELALRFHMHVRRAADDTVEVVRWYADGRGHVVEAAGFPSEGQAWLGAASLLREEIEGEAVPA
jgi:hypothetical protein